MKVTQICIGRFHHFHLARQLEKYNLLKEIWSGFPFFKLKDEQNISREKIKTFPWIQTPYMGRHLLGLQNWQWLEKNMAWLAYQTLDNYVATKIKEPTILFSLSGSGLNSGKKAINIGGHYICDRSSSHIVYQNQILTEEYAKWNLKFKGIDPRIIAKEEEEYQLAEFITVPSEFVKNSFIEKGIPQEKILKIPFGARLERFYKIENPKINKFIILWVGQVSIRKGFLYLLDAFNLFKHPNKDLIVIGFVTPEITKIIRNRKLQNVKFLGIIPNYELIKYYNLASVFVLPSIEEGLACVQGEALACGCPVIATHNSGAEDLFTNEKEGYIIPIRSSEAILEKLNILADNKELREEMSESAVKCIKKLGGWDTYGEDFVKFINKVNNDK